MLVFLAAGQPWWGMLLRAPQYPQGLEIVATLQGMRGDVHEVDTLNHYIGMIPLGEAARAELKAAPYAVPAMAAMALASAFWSGWGGWALRAPLVAFPIFFLADLKAWMWWAGNHLDPHAPMNRAIQRFTPTLLGEGRIAQFVTYGFLDTGFWLASLAAALALAAGFVPCSRRGGGRP